MTTTGTTRDRILQAALEVCAQKGYHRALVDDIVRVSGTSKGAVYHHFPNKEALFLALVDDFAGRLAEAVAGAIGSAVCALWSGARCCFPVTVCSIVSECRAVLFRIRCVSFSPLTFPPCCPSGR